MNRSPLDDLHRRLGARFVEFGGWEMPVQYESVLAEHKAVRNAVGIFDVSHLGRFELSGSGAHDALLELLCNNVERIEPGRTQYTMMLNPSAGIIDDLIIWWWEPDRFWVLPNAANQERVMAAFAARPGCSTRSLREETVLIAVQGPSAPAGAGGGIGIVSEADFGSPRRLGRGPRSGSQAPATRARPVARWCVTRRPESGSSRP